MSTPASKCIYSLEKCMELVIALGMITVQLLEAPYIRGRVHHEALLALQIDKQVLGFPQESSFTRAVVDANSNCPQLA